MNTYTQWLNLDFDPFAPDATSRDFYCSGHRQNLLDQIVEFSLYSNAMICRYRALGRGQDYPCYKSSVIDSLMRLCVCKGGCYFVHESGANF